ncbi:MAG: co-chaperone GroES family protein [Deltaproteobacteria bacterium]|nr:co-chaperone GroES family protein [Deltaproteobacteria bacterium]
MDVKKNIIVVGDKVLIEPDEENLKTDGGLYLPPTVKEKEKVLSGRVVKTGPGYAVYDPGSVYELPSGAKLKDVKYIPLQAQEGDYAIFVKESSVEIDFQGKKYLIIPHHSILALIREEKRSDIPA